MGLADRLKGAHETLRGVYDSLDSQGIVLPSNIGPQIDTLREALMLHDNIGEADYLAITHKSGFSHAKFWAQEVVDRTLASEPIDRNDLEMACRFLHAAYVTEQSKPQRIEIVSPPIKRRFHLYSTSPIKADNPGLQQILDGTTGTCLMIEGDSQEGRAVSKLIADRYGPNSLFSAKNRRGVRPCLVDSKTGLVTTGRNSHAVPGEGYHIGPIFIDENIASDVFAELRGMGYHQAHCADYDTLLDHLSQAGLPDQVLQEVSDYLSKVAANPSVSKNRTFHATTKSGEKVFLKVSQNRKTARLEAAANFYLSQRFNFIAPGMFSEPLEANGVYVNIQQDVTDKTSSVMSLEYWISSLALFHKESERILAEEGVELSDYVVGPFDKILEQQEQAKGQGTQRFSLDRTRLQEAFSYLESTSYKTAIHGDNKNLNRFGRYLIDLELMGKGSPAIDLSLLLMQYDVPKERWNDYLGMYLTAKGTTEYDTEMRELKQGVEHASYYAAAREVISSSSKAQISRRTEKDNAQLISFV